MENIIFKEKQYFNDKMVFLLLGGGMVGTLFILIKSFTLDRLIIGNILFAVIVTSAFGFLFWWLKRLKFKISVNGKRIKYKMSPIHFKARKISWADVESWEVVKTPPAAQWHGSNISFSGESWFSLTGRNGLSIKTKDGQCFFIGCKDVDGLAATLEKFSFR